MPAIPNTIDTVNAAASAIATADTRVQPSSVQKRRWGSCWSLYWCFGSHNHSKRIGHAVLVPEPTMSTPSAPNSENLHHTTSIVLPFIAPPSSPASFLQSDPPSATHTPAGLLSLTSLSVSAYCTGGTASIFTIGPYAHETQVVTPPVFSAGTTEPSTAAYTPPPESVQPTAPSSPEVPFAQLLASSLARNRRNSKTNQKFSLTQYEFSPYQYPDSPGGQLRSPGSAVSYSGNSSPYPDKHPVYDFRTGEASKYLGYDHFTTYKWGSRLGSGSLTPNGWGSRLGSGTATPSGAVSRLGSGSLTPNGGTPASQDIYLVNSQIWGVASLVNSENESQNQEVFIDHRVSFELIHDEVQTASEGVLPALDRITSEPPADRAAEGTTDEDVMKRESEFSCEYCAEKTIDGSQGEDLEEEPEKCFHKRRTITLGSSKEFNFDNTKGEVLDKSTVECEWWKNENFAGDKIGSDNEWTFFPVLQPGVN